MTIPRQPEPPSRQAPAGTAGDATPDDQLDEALEESFPASDPVAVSITTVEPPPGARPAPRD